MNSSIKRILQLDESYTLYSDKSYNQTNPTIKRIIHSDQFFNTRILHLDEACNTRILYSDESFIQMSPTFRRNPDLLRVFRFPPPIKLTTTVELIYW